MDRSYDFAKREVMTGDVIQANENAGEWAGCTLVVETVKTGFVRACMKVPFQGKANVNLKHEDYDYIGKAAMKY